MPLTNLMRAQMRALADQASAQAEAIRQHDIEVARQLPQREAQRNDPEPPDLDSTRLVSDLQDLLASWDAPNDEGSDETEDEDDVDSVEDESEVDSEEDIASLRDEKPPWVIPTQSGLRVVTIDTAKNQVTWPLLAGEVGASFLQWLCSQDCWTQIQTPATIRVNLEPFGWIGTRREGSVVWERKLPPAPIELEF